MHIPHSDYARLPKGNLVAFFLTSNGAAQNVSCPAMVHLRAKCALFAQNMGGLQAVRAAAMSPRFHMGDAP